MVPIPPARPRHVPSGHAGYRAGTALHQGQHARSRPSKTQMFDQDSDNVRQALYARTSGKGSGNPDAVMGGAMFLASDGSTYVSVTERVIGGGQVCVAGIIAVRRCPTPHRFSRPIGFPLDPAVRCARQHIGTPIVDHERDRQEGMSGMGRERTYPITVQGQICRQCLQTDWCDAPRTSARRRLLVYLRSSADSPSIAKK